MRISDWSSDVCASDVERPVERGGTVRIGRDADFLGELLRSLVAVLVDDIERRAFEVAAIGNPKLLQRGDRGDRCKIGLIIDPPDIRSEEHTSELQSLMRNSYAVFCLTKKKNN